MLVNKNNKDKALEIRSFLLDMVADARRECRDFTEEEQKLFDDQKNELLALSERISAAEDRLDELESLIPEVEEAVEEAKAAVAEPEAEPQPAPEEPQTEPEPAPEDQNPEKKSAAHDEDAKTPESPKINTENEAVEEPQPASEEPKKKEEKSFKTQNIMKKDFSLIRAIRSAVDGTPQDEITQAVLEAGKKSFRDAGLGMSGQIQLPLEKRTFTVTDAHDDIIETEFDSLLTPLYANRVLQKARWYTGLVGDLQLPGLEAGEEARWEGENTSNKEVTNDTYSIKLTPHRLSVSTRISKQALAQDSIGIENAIRKDLLDNLYNKLEKTFLSATAAAGNVPGGIFAGLTPEVVTDYKGICDLEAAFEEANFNGTKEYIFSPKAKAAFRQMTFGGGRVQRMVMEGGEIDGTPYSFTTNVAENKFGLVNWDAVRIGQWSGIDLVVDPYTAARTAEVIITLNAYFDCKVARPELIKYGSVVAVTNPAG